MRSVILSLLFLTLAPVVACGADSATDADDESGEPAQDEAAVVAMTGTDESAPADSLAPAPLDHTDVDLLDIRGVGDSGWSKTHERTPLQAQFGAALDRFDRSGKGYKGDLSFINWETVVGNSCDRFGSAYSPGRSYAFVSRPENLTQALDKGFNLIGLSNNHTRDCHGSSETSKTGEAASPDMTAKAIAALGEKPWITAGVGDTSNKAAIRSFTIKGKTIRVALGSIYTGRPDCPAAACSGDATELFTSLRDAQADIRILSMHSMAAADQDVLVRKGIEFVEQYKGDIVFGSGPHVWKPVRVVRKSDGSGGKGVIFESLGNFLHPSLGAQSKNFIGRALFDMESKKLRQVQLLPVANAGTDVKWSQSSATAIDSNLRWTKLPDSQAAVYANVKP
jgi:hypothetical protein